MKLLFGVEIDGCSENQRGRLEEMVAQFVAELPSRISVKRAHIRGIKEATDNEVSKPKQKSPKGARSSGGQSGIKAGQAH